MSRRIQNKIAGSRYALPVTMGYGVVALLFLGLLDEEHWLSFGCLYLSTLLMVLLNNVYALIRIYSRMVSCSFLALTIMHIAQLPPMGQDVSQLALASDTVANIVQLCFISSYFCLFKAYQDDFAPGWVFFSFFFFGIASIFFVQMLFYLPLLWMMLGVNVLGFSFRNFCASLMGILLPFWMVVSYAVYTGHPLEFYGYYKTVGVFAPMFDYSHVEMRQIIPFAFMVVLFLTGTIHFLRHSYKDKIRTRMIYESFITMGLCTVLFLLAQPQHYQCLMRVFIIVTSPLIAHFMSLTETRITNIAFMVIVVTTFLITFCNQWMLSLLS